MCCENIKEKKKRNSDFADDNFDLYFLFLQQLLVKLIVYVSSHNVRLELPNMFAGTIFTDGF